MVEKQLKFEKESMYYTAFLQLNAIAGGTHGNKESIKLIQDGLKDEEDKGEWPEERIRRYAEFFGEPVEKLRKMIAKGWKPSITLKE